MKILVINSGSSSIKASLFEFDKEAKEIMSSMIDGIGLARCRFTYKSATKNLGQHTTVKKHEDGVKLILETMKINGQIKQYNDIKAVGHRVVHGGEKYSNSVKIDAKVMKAIEDLKGLAPLHNPLNLASIRACKAMLPKSKQVAVFDTAFHNSMPEKAYLYGLPYEMYEKHKIRRYGFHGTSHKSVVEKAVKLLKHKNSKIISCHVGNGVSVTASLNGKSIDTSMGFTPLEGVIMGTRSGSIDPAIIFYMQKELKIKDVENILNHESGIKGLSEISSDMRDIYAKSLKDNKKALLTMNILAYQLAKCCGSYVAALNGLDALIFTGGIGENAFYIRKLVCQYLEFLGLNLDTKLNEKNALEVSTSKSKVKVFVIPTDEEKQIAIETMALI